MRVLPEPAETVTLKLFSPRPLGLTETLRTLQNLGLTVVEELRIPLALPEGRRACWTASRSRRPPSASPRWREGERALRRGAARARRGARHRRPAQRAWS